MKFRIDQPSGMTTTAAKISALVIIISAAALFANRLKHQNNSFSSKDLAHLKHLKSESRYPLTYHPETEIASNITNVHYKASDSPRHKRRKAVDADQIRNILARLRNLKPDVDSFSEGEESVISSLSGVDSSANDEKDSMANSALVGNSVKEIEKVKTNSNTSKVVSKADELVDKSPPKSDESENSLNSITKEEYAQLFSNVFDTFSKEHVIRKIKVEYGDEKTVCYGNVCFDVPANIDYDSAGSTGSVIYKSGSDDDDLNDFVTPDSIPNDHVNSPKSPKTVAKPIVKDSNLADTSSKTISEAKDKFPGVTVEPPSEADQLDTTKPNEKMLEATDRGETSRLKKVLETATGKSNQYKIIDHVERRQSSYTDLTPIREEEPHEVSGDEKTVTVAPPSYADKVKISEFKYTMA